MQRAVPWFLCAANAVIGGTGVVFAQSVLNPDPTGVPC